MKKRIKQLLVPGLIMMLFLSGCTEQKEPVSEQMPQAEAEGEAEEAEEFQAEEVVTETAKEETPLKVNIVRNQKNYCLDDTKEVYLYLQYSDVTVDGGNNENLNRNIENWSMEQSEKLRSQAAFFEKDAEKKEGEEVFDSFSLSQNVEAARIDSQIVSLIEDTYSYVGGEHGNYYRTGVNFNAESGKRIQFQEIFSDFENFKRHASESMIRQLQENYGEELKEDYIETVEHMWLEETSPEWYFDGSGIVVVIQQYVVGDYFMGTPEIHLPYSEFGQYLKEMYLPTMSDGVSKFDINQEIYLQLPDQNEEASLMLQYKEIDGIPECTLWLGNQKKSIDNFAALTNAYLLKNKGEIFCLIEVDFASDDFVTYIYRLTEGRLQEIDQVDASIDAGNINSDEIVMEFWVNLLGTYGGVKTYHLNENYEFVTEDTEYILHKNEFVLTTTADFPIQLEGMESILPAGSHIVLNSTDNESFVAFTIQETGQNGILFVERDEKDYYCVSINGMDENECFEILPYAG